MNIIRQYQGMPLILNPGTMEQFEITDAVSMRRFVQLTCDSLKAKGRNQKFCSRFFTDWFSSQFPHHNFTDHDLNPVLENRIYNNIRKAISDYWKEQRAQLADEEASD